MTTQEFQQSITKSEFKEYLTKGFLYDQYKQNMADDLSSNPDAAIKNYIDLNQHRTSRVEKTFAFSEEIKTQLSALKQKIYWLVITEHWCGDSAQNIPVFHQIAEASEGKIELKFVYRDQNPELMDAFLTNHSRSIPKLIQLDSHFNVNGIWGPRPSIAQKLVLKLKANPATAENYANELHLWYAKNRQSAISTEIEKLLFKANQFCPECLIG